MFKILVVEDDKELNKTVCSFLNHSGYETGLLTFQQVHMEVKKCKKDMKHLRF